MIVEALPLPRVEGYCPLGCGETLFLGAGGHITCSFVECPNPAAVSELLGDSESEHVVTFTETEFTVQHPLRERLDGALHECSLHRFIAGHAYAPLRPGRYRATAGSRFGGDGDWSWTRLPELEGAAV